MFKKTMTLLTAVVLASCMCGSVFAERNDFMGVGNWNDPNLWTLGTPPWPGDEVMITTDANNPITVCTLNSDTAGWDQQRVRIDAGAVLKIEEGAELVNTEWLRPGVDGVGGIVQTGGLVNLGSKVGIGDKPGGQGYWTISGGTLTYTGRGDFYVGGREGTGVFTVVGTAPTILVQDLVLGDRAGAAGTLEFKVDVNGVSPIAVDDDVKIDVLGDTTNAALVVSAIGVPPTEDILLVDALSATKDIQGRFETVNGNPALEGAKVFLSYGGLTCAYTLTYVGGTGNDIVLVYQYSFENPKIIWVTGTKDVDEDGIQDDMGWVDWLAGLGYAVDIRPDYWSGSDLDPNKIAELEAADLVMISRAIGSGDPKPETFNPLTTPIINLNAWTMRSSRLKWLNSGTATKYNGAPLLVPAVGSENHPIFEGVDLSEGTLEVLDPNVGAGEVVEGNTSFVDINDAGNGTVLATALGSTLVANEVFIAEWAAGVEYYEGAGQFAGGPRMVFMAGTQDLSGDNPDPTLPVTSGVFNLTEVGAQIMANAVNYMIPPTTESIPVENFSFELPGDALYKNWDLVPGWSSDSVAEFSGADATGEYPVTDGVSNGYLQASDPSVYNLLTYVIEAGDVLTLSADAFNEWTDTTYTGDVQFEMTLYYDNAGTRVPLASKVFSLTVSDMGMASTPEFFTVTANVDDVPASIGAKLGVELNNVTPTADTPAGSWIGMDNIEVKKAL